MSAAWVIEHRRPTIVVRGFKADDRLRTWGYKPLWSVSAKGWVVDDRHLRDIIARAEREHVQHRVAQVGEQERRSVERARTNLEKAAKEIIWQIEHRAWEVLGYASWDEMRQAEYGGVAVMVPSKDRPQLTTALREAGLTQKQTAATIGVTERTVRSDEATGKVSGPPLRAQRRGSLPDQLRSALHELDRITRRIERIAADDRFAPGSATYEPLLAAVSRHALLLDSIAARSEQR